MVLFVANFDKQTDADDLRTLFSNYGTVVDVSIFRDRHTEESLGYAFVEIPDEWEAEKAISDLNGRWWNGRKLKVNQRRPR
jgi:RNA recognition motif-containing protein